MMSRGLKIGIASFAVIWIACFAAILIWRNSEQNRDVLAGWGKGSLSTAEQTFYANRMKRIVAFWHAAAEWTAQWRENGRIGRPNDVFLVINPESAAIWVEYKGKVVKELYSELPGGMDWSVHQLTPDGSKNLPGIVRLQVRGMYTSRIFAETIYLEGAGRDWDRNFQIRPNTYGLSLGTSERIAVPKYNRELPEDDDPYRSIIVGEQEYNTYLAKLENRDEENLQEGIVESLFHDSSVLRENLHQWHRVEKRLFAEIDRQLSQAGFETSRMEVVSGPDYLAGHAEARGRDDGLSINGWFSKGAVDVNLKYEHLGEGVWYAVSVPGRFPTIMRNSIEMEFLVSETGDLDPDETGKWLTKGRSLMSPEKPVPFQWQAELDNGVVVEFIGLCENPSGGKLWFGPDGSELDFIPYQNFERYGRKGDERSIYEFAWRVHWPSEGPKGSTGSAEGATGSYSHQILDKYGYRMVYQIERFEAQGFSFQEGQEKTTLKLGFKMGEADHSYVRFEDISLVRGIDMGFKIVLGEMDDTLE